MKKDGWKDRALAKHPDARATRGGEGWIVTAPSAAGMMISGTAGTAPGANAAWREFALRAEGHEPHDPPYRTSARLMRQHKEMALMLEKASATLDVHAERFEEEGFQELAEGSARVRDAIDTLPEEIR